MKKLYSLILLTAICFSCIITTDCFALQEEPALSVNVQEDDRSFVLANYTLGELQKMPQTQLVYSSVNFYDAPSVVMAQGFS